MAFLSVVTTVRATSQEDFRYGVYKSNGTAYIEKYIGSSAVVDVPSSSRADSGDRDDEGNPIYRNYTVTCISKYAFSGNVGITQVSIPETITDGSKLCIFAECTNLREVNFKGVVRDIPTGMFSKCSNLRTLDLRWDSVESIGSEAFLDCGYDFGVLDYLPNVKTIGARAFGNVQTLTSVSLSSLRRIEREAFIGCGNLESASVDGAGLRLEGGGENDYYTYGPFARCPKLRTVRLGDGVVSIPYRLFYGSTNLEMVEFGRGIQELVERFSNQKNLRSFVAKGRIGKLPSNMFDGCEMLSEIGFQWENVTNVGEYAFSGCTNWVVEELNFLSNVEKYGRCAFRDCHKIYEAVIPETVATVSDGVFRGCRGLSNVVWEAERVPPSGFRDCTQLSTLVF